MRKTTGLVLAFIFILYLGGMELLYSLRINAAKNQSESLIEKHKVPLDNTVDFSFTSEQYNTLNWSERNKEFTYNGQHYDIVSIAFYTDEIKITCYDDSKETSLINEFTGFVKRMFSQSAKTNNTGNDIANKICKEYLPNENLNPRFFFYVITTINANCVLVNQHALIADVWRPPSVV
jgi:hypothetical protein